MKVWSRTFSFMSCAVTCNCQRDSLPLWDCLEIYMVTHQSKALKRPPPLYPHVKISKLNVQLVIAVAWACCRKPSWGKSMLKALQESRPLDWCRNDSFTWLSQGIATGWWCQLQKKHMDSSWISHGSQICDDKGGSQDCRRMREAVLAGGTPFTSITSTNKFKFWY